MKKTPNTLPNLEDSLTEINQLIDQMEHNELSLDQSLQHFERGIHLIKHCQKILNDAEQKVQILIQNHNQEVLTSYGNENKNDEGRDENETNQ